MDAPPCPCVAGNGDASCRKSRAVDVPYYNGFGCARPHSFVLAHQSISRQCNVRAIHKFVLSVSPSRYIFSGSKPLNSCLRHTKYGKVSGTCLEIDIFRKPKSKMQ